MTETTTASFNVTAIDTETTGKQWYDTAFGASTDDERGSRWFELPSEVQTLREWVADRELVMHNAKFDLQKLIRAGVLDRDNLPKFHDTEALSHLLDEHRPKRLKQLARDVLGLTTDEEEVVKATRKKLGLKASDGYDKLPRDVVIPYAIRDAEITLLLWRHFWPSLCNSEELVHLYEQEMELTLALLDMEWEGMAVDTEYLERTAKEYAGKILEAEIAIREITQIEDPKFPNSPKQILAWFEDHGISLKGTGKEHLADLDHPLAQHILDLRKLRKIEGTYLRGLLEIERNGIVHPGIRQHGTVTGRASSGGYDGD